MAGFLPALPLGVALAVSRMAARAKRARRGASVAQGVGWAVCSLPAMGGAKGSRCPIRLAGRPVALVSIVQSSAGQTGEEPMTLTATILLINAIAQLAASAAQLVMALRHGRRR